MESKVKNNILFIALDEKFGEEVAKEIADTLFMHFASAKALINYDLFNSEDVLTCCGENYYLQRERNVISSICNYDNTLIFSNYDIFSHNEEVFSQKTTSVYLRLPEKELSKSEKINIISYKNRDEKLKNEVDLSIDITGKDKKRAVKIIYKCLGGL